MDKEYSKSSKNEKPSQYWKNKPVAKLNDFVYSSSRINDLNENLFCKGTTQNPLPKSMNWNIIEISDNKNLEIACDFLNRHYQDKNKICIGVDLIKWNLGNGGFILSIVNNNNAMCGMIGCGIRNMIVCDKKEKFAYVNFMCAHPSYRKKNIAQTLMNELARYVNVDKKISQGIFMSSKKICRPVSILRKYYRPINYLKLNDSGFLSIEGNIEVINKKFIVKGTPDSSFVPIKSEHMDDVYTLYNKYMSQYNISCCYEKEELSNLLFDNIVKSYVVIRNGEVIDFVSYCQINYTGKEGIQIRSGHIFLYSLNTEYGENMMDNLIKIMAEDNIDVMISFDDMDINNILLSENFDDKDSDVETYDKVYEHKFLKQKKSYVNLFNWKAPFLSSQKISLFFI